MIHSLCNQSSFNRFIVLSKVEMVDLPINSFKKCWWKFCEFNVSKWLNVTLHFLIRYPEKLVNKLTV
jgi:hypothetical protein